MSPNVIFISAIILCLFAGFKTYANIEQFFLKTATKKISYAGILLSIISICCLFFARMKTVNTHYVTGFDLVFKYRLILAEVFVISNIFIIAALFFRNLVDRFRYAVIFSIINLVSWYLIGMVGMGNHFIDMNIDYFSGILLGLNFMTPLIQILMFGIESNKTEPKANIFKFVRTIGANIQKEYDRGQVMEAKYEKNPAAVPKKYIKTQNALVISSGIFVVVLVLWVVAIGFCQNLTSLVGYAGLVIIIGAYIAWLLIYFRGKIL